VKNRGEEKNRGSFDLQPYQPPPPFFTGRKLRPPALGIEILMTYFVLLSHNSAHNLIPVKREHCNDFSVCFSYARPKQNTIITIMKRALFNLFTVLRYTCILYTLNSIKRIFSQRRRHKFARKRTKQNECPQQSPKAKPLWDLNPEPKKLKTQAKYLINDTREKTARPKKLAHVYC